MNKTAYRPSFILIILLLLIACDTQIQGYLHTSGTQIVNRAGEPVLLRGIGLGGWMLQEPYMLKLPDSIKTQHEFRAKVEGLIGEKRTKKFYNAWLKYGIQKSDIDSLAKWGFNSVRLPMHYNLFTLPVDEEPAEGQITWLKKGFALTDSLLKWCAANEMYLILDLHAAPGGQGHNISISDRDPGEPSLWQSEANQQKTIALWKKLAKRYKDKKWIGGYDLINEPNWSFVNPQDREDHGCNDTLNVPLRKFYIEITDAIRSVDKNHIIFIEGNCWATNFKGLFPLWDDNMVISFHKYWSETTVASIRKFLSIRKKYNIPLWMGESGENSNEWYRNAIELFESHNIGWAWWPLKKIGTNQPFEVKMPPGFRDIIQYWKGKGPKPSADEAYQALLQLARNYKTKNLTVHYDVLDALFQRNK